MGILDMYYNKLLSRAWIIKHLNQKLYSRAVYIIVSQPVGEYIISKIVNMKCASFLTVDSSRLSQT